MVKPPIRWVYTLSLVTLLVVACSDDKKPATTPIPEDPRKTIEGLVGEIKDAYEARDLDRYDRLFDQERFLFVFDELDVRENPDIPESWGWPEERASARNMFGSTLVQRIQVDCVMATPVPVTKADIGDRPFPEGTMKAILTDVDLVVDTADPNGGENIIFTVPGDRAQFFVYQDAGEVVDGVPVWKIFEWRDEKVGATPGIGDQRGTLENSWGRVKHEFRSDSP